MNVEKAKKLFNEFDKDGSGSMEKGEVIDALRLYGLNPTKSQYNDLIKRFDFDGSNTLSFDEFYQVLEAGYISPEEENDMLMDALRKADLDNSGTLNKKELVRLLTSFGEDPLSQEEADEWLEMVYGDRPAVLTFEQVVEMFSDSREIGESGDVGGDGAAAGGEEQVPTATEVASDRLREACVDEDSTQTHLQHLLVEELFACLGREGGRRVYVGLMQPKGRALTFVAASPGSDMAGRTLERGNGLLFQCIDDGATVAIEAVEDSQHPVHFYSPARIGPFAAVPYGDSDGAIGVVAVEALGEEGPTAPPLSEEELSFLQDAAWMVGAAVDQRRKKEALRVLRDAASERGATSSSLLAVALSAVKGSVLHGAKVEVWRSTDDGVESVARIDEKGELEAEAKGVEGKAKEAMEAAKEEAYDGVVAAEGDPHHTLVAAFTDGEGDPDALYALASRHHAAGVEFSTADGDFLVEAAQALQEALALMWARADEGEEEHEVTAEEREATRDKAMDRMRDASVDEAAAQDEMLRVMVREVSHVFPSHAVYVGLAQPQGQGIAYVAAAGMSAMQDKVLERGEGVSFAVLDKGETVHISDVASADPAPKLFGEGKAGPLIVVPLGDTDAPVGVLAVDGVGDDGAARDLAEEEVAFLQDAAWMVGAAIEERRKRGALRSVRDVALGEDASAPTVFAAALGALKTCLPDAVDGEVWQAAAADEEGGAREVVALVRVDDDGHVDADPRPLGDRSEAAFKAMEAAKEEAHDGVVAAGDDAAHHTLVATFTDEEGDPGALYALASRHRATDVPFSSAAGEFAVDVAKAVADTLAAIWRIRDR